MLSLNDLKYHCRICLIKIENFADKEDTKKYVSIAKYPDVEHVIRCCLSKTSGGDTTVDQRIDFYMPNLCHVCLTKWQDFSIHYMLAVKNDEILRKILDREQPFELEVLEKCEEVMFALKSLQEV